ncbi:MAG: hypothetical protein ACUVTL_05310 [Thermoproteota archaeon]
MAYLDDAYGRLLKSFGGRSFGSKEVAKALGLRPGYVKNLLSELRRRGWISAMPDPSDARRAIYRLDLAAAGEVDSDLAQSMLGEHIGEYVLLVNGAIVDKDGDVQRLLKRALKRYKPEQIFITSAGRPREIVTIGF